MKTRSFAKTFAVLFLLLVMFGKPLNAWAYSLFSEYEKLYEQMSGSLKFGFAYIDNDSMPDLFVWKYSSQKDYPYTLYYIPSLKRTDQSHSGYMAAAKVLSVKNMQDFRSIKYIESGDTFRAEYYDYYRTHQGVEFFFPDDGWMSCCYYDSDYCGYDEDNKKITLKNEEKELINKYYIVPEKQYGTKEIIFSDTDQANIEKAFAKVKNRISIEDAVINVRSFNEDNIYDSGIMVSYYDAGSEKNISLEENRHYSLSVKKSDGTIYAAIEGKGFFKGSKTAAIGTIKKKRQKISAEDISLAARTKRFVYSLKADAKGQITYSTDNKKVKIKKNKLYIPADYCGIIKVNIKAASVSTEESAIVYSSAKKTITVSVVPGGVKIKKLKINKSNDKATIGWQKRKGGTGYQLQVAGNAAFKKARTFNTGSTGRSIPVTSGNTYYLRVRTFIKDNKGNILNSQWSTARSLDVLPDTPEVKSIQKKPGERLLSWEKITGATGYELQVSEDKSFDKDLDVYKTKKTEQVISVKKSVKYYLRVRSVIEKSNGKKYYSKWSEVKIKNMKKHES